jgi:hypothetical protein
MEEKTVPAAFYLSGHISPPKNPEVRHQVLVLLDSGATTSAIDRKTVEKYKLRLTPLPTAVRAINADGTDNISGYITHTCDLLFHVGNHTAQWPFRVIELHDADIYLGFDWLYHYNPPINWKDLTLTIKEQEIIRRTRLLPPLPDDSPQEYAEFAQVFTQENFLTLHLRGGTIH